jgi:ribonuclease Z
VPTRERNQNGYVLRWDDHGILFDPGEGTQRQLLRAGISSSAIDVICITHLHGDHCLGLPGVLARLALDRHQGPVDLYFPATGAEYVERLCSAAVFDQSADLHLHAVPVEGAVFDRGSFRLVAVPLEHSIDTLGWRIEEPDARHLLSERLEALGIRGRDIGELLRTGILEIGARRVTIADVSESRHGQCFAFIMDTRPCDGASALADRADMVVCESTFLETEADLANSYWHMTARQAGLLAAEAGARRLVLTHYSQRYRDEASFFSEARTVFSDVVAARDLTTVALPRRREATD